MRARSSGPKNGKLHLTAERSVEVQARAPPHLIRCRGPSGWPVKLGTRIGSSKSLCGPQKRPDTERERGAS